MITANLDDAVIGFTGFVGGHLTRQKKFRGKFNSSNVIEAEGRRFDVVACAAAPGSMFEANRFPKRDHVNIVKLIEHLSRIEARQFILISSIAVLGAFDGQYTEDKVVYQVASPYGRHRRELEEFCGNHFKNCLIVRLPALFGAGLKKNFIFDIMNPMPSMLTEERLSYLAAKLPQNLSSTLRNMYFKNSDLDLFVLDRNAWAYTNFRYELNQAVTEIGMSAVQFTNPESQFQYYDMNRLWLDVQIGLQNGLEMLHLAPEPVLARHVFQTLTGQDMPENGARLHTEDMRTSYAKLWGRNGPYICSREEVLKQLSTFFQEEKCKL